VRDRDVTEREVRLPLRERDIEERLLTRERERDKNWFLREGE